jgi:hypothetical protein
MDVIRFTVWRKRAVSDSLGDTSHGMKTGMSSTSSSSIEKWVKQLPVNFPFLG